MINTDLHLHTLYSHGKNSLFEIHAAAQKKGLQLIGFTEHSPRPLGYDYTHEYREQLQRHFNDYIREVSKLRDNSENAASCKVLLGLEMDWIPAEEDFVRKACGAYAYDYLIGSVHFLGHWGFDDERVPWEKASEAQIFSWYEEYFITWLSMLNTGLFQIAAHPDLIKIFSVQKFHKWLEKKTSRELIQKGLLILKEANMAMEISSAGLRKPCAEIYPCSVIMRMASEMNLNITFASDAHNIDDVGYAFGQLEAYAKKHGFRKQALYKQGQIEYLPF